MTVEIWTNYIEFIESTNLMNHEIDFVGIENFKYNDKDSGQNYAVLVSKSKDSKA